MHFVLKPGTPTCYLLEAFDSAVFITYSAIMFTLVFVLIFYHARKYKTSPIVFITICSIFGSFTVVATQGKSIHPSFRT